MTKQRTYDHDRLLFRRQFILGPRFLEGFPTWQRLIVRPGYCLTVHPDLPVYMANSGDKSVILLGYILDPHRPDVGNEEIVNGLLSCLTAGETPDGIIRLTYSLGGRWVLILDDGRTFRLFHDAMGLRQVFYTNPCHRERWCASQSALLAEVLQLEMDAEAVAFLQSDENQGWEELLWPVDRTPYREITLLLPNHDLDLATGIRRRYWPDRPLGRLTLEDGVQQVGHLLKNLLQSAANRFDLALAITAGYDSRLALAAAHDVRKNLYCFSLCRHEVDVLVPRRLLPKLGLQHHVVRYPPTMEPEFAALYRRNITSAHDLWGRMAQALWEHLPSDRVCVKGNASEIARVRFRLPPEKPVTPVNLAGFSRYHSMYHEGIRQNAYAVRAWGEWLRDVGELHDIHLMDLYYWEYYAGNFVGMAQAEWDIVHEVFTPYNCRTLLTTMLAVEEKYRDHDAPILYQNIMNTLWPDVLDAPFNPPPPVRIRERLLRIPRRLVRWSQALAENILSK